MFKLIISLGNNCLPLVYISFIWPSICLNNNIHLAALPSVFFFYFFFISSNILQALLNWVAVILINVSIGEYWVQVNN